MYGPTGVAAGAGTGVLRSLHCDGSMQANVVPGDMVVNALIASAWDIAEIKKQVSFFYVQSIPHFFSSPLKRESCTRTKKALLNFIFCLFFTILSSILFLARNFTMMTKKKYH